MLLFLLFSVDCDGMHTCQNGQCIDSNFVCVMSLFFQWIMRVCTLVRMADALTAISSVLLSMLFSVNCDGMRFCQNGRCIDSNFVCVIVVVFYSGL